MTKKPGWFFLRGGLFCLAGFVLGACASVSVKETVPYKHESAPIVPPSGIFIAQFGAPESAFDVDRSGEELRKFILDKRERFAVALAERVSKRVVKAVPLAPGSIPPRGNFWLVTGTFDSVRQGSRALRMAVGFGMGRTRIDTTAHVFDLSGPQPVLLFTVRTTGGSGAMPGAVGAISPLGWNPLTLAGIVMNTVGGANSGLGFDMTRTAREVAAAISEFASERDLIPEERAAKPKRLGELPVPDVLP